MPTGRNDPCPCGSAKKFKKCCGNPVTLLANSDPSVVRANAVKAADVELHSQLLRFIKRSASSSWLTDALTWYRGDAPDDVINVEMELAIPWTIYHYPTFDNGESQASAFRTDRQTQIAPNVLEVLDAQLLSYPSVWNVADVEPGVGLFLVDLLTNETQFVYDVAASQSLHVDDAILARVVHCDTVAFIAGLFPYTLTPRHAALVVTKMRWKCRVRTRPIKPARLRDPEIQLDLLYFWRYEFGAQHAPPKITNTDGDPMTFVTDRFDFNPEQRTDVIDALQLLDGASDAQSIDKAVEIVITKRGNAQHETWDNTVVGRLEVQKARLLVETNSLRRADALRAQIDVRLSVLVRYRIREETSSAAAMNPQLATFGAPRAEVTDDPSPEMHDRVRQFREQYMLGWLDECIPALNGLTPRQAAKDPKKRSALETLLREGEHMESRFPDADRIDYRQIRTTLGM
jgi:SEC-C motif